MTSPAFAPGSAVTAATTAALELEQAALGVVLNDPAAWDSLRDIRPDDFLEGEHGAHGSLWAAVRQDFDGGIAPDPHTLSVRFADRLGDYGGARYVLDLWDKAPAADTAPKLAQQLSASAIQRRLMRVLSRPGLSAREIDGALSVEAERTRALAERARPITATAFEWVDPASMPPREWLYGKHLIRRFVSSTVAPGGVGKSSLLLVEALAMATGRPLLGEKPAGQLRVWVWSGEDPLEESQRRVLAACIEHGITPADFAGRLFVDSGRDMPLVMAKSTKNGVEINAPAGRQIEREIKARGIDVLVVDPFVSSHACDENDNAAINAVVCQWKDIADRTGCAVELVHHVKKPGSASGSTTVDDGRGASAMLAAVRSARVLNRMSPQEAEEFGVTDRENYVRVDNGKANLAPRGAAKWRRIVTVQLGNGPDGFGDSVGVVSEWKPPSVFDGLTAHDTRRVQEAISAGLWKQSPMSKDWAGRCIAGCLDLDADADKAKLSRLLREWLAAGVLAVERRRDDQRKERPCVVVGNWVNP